MTFRKGLSVVCCALILIVVATQSITAQAITAQDAQQQANLNIELYVLIASNDPLKEGKIPATLDPVMKQLRQTLPFRNYSLETTLVNRVKNGGTLNLSWIVGPLSKGLTSPNSTPTFNEFSIGQLRIMPDSDRGQVIQMTHFAFGSRIPIQTGVNIAASTTTTAPVFSYERVGLTTDLSVHDGEPALVGTLNVGPSGEAIVLAIAARRVPN